MADGVKENVARVAQRLGDIIKAVCQVRGVYPALGRVALGGVLGVNTGTLDAGAGADDLLGKSRDRRAGLEGRARGVGALERTVKQRRIFRRQKL